MCFGSSQSAGNQVQLQARPRLVQVPPPQGGLQIVPAPQRDSTSSPVRHVYDDLTSENLRQALQIVADFLKSQHAKIMLIAVGDVVNTILLRTRQTMHDVDFFNVNLTTQSAGLLREAAQFAQSASSVPLGGDWLNDSTILYIPRALQQELTEDAINQNEVIFQTTNLTVLAVPWQYALCAKVDRMTKRNRRDYDVRDAAVYLHRLMQRGNNRRPMPAAQIQERAAHYGIQAPEAQLREVDREYQRLYHRPGIAF